MKLDWKIFVILTSFPSTFTHFWSKCEPILNKGLVNSLHTRGVQMLVTSRVTGFINPGLSSSFPCHIGNSLQHLVSPFLIFTVRVPHLWIIAASPATWLAKVLPLSSLKYSRFCLIRAWDVIISCLWASQMRRLMSI